MPEGVVTKAILPSPQGPTQGQLKDTSTDELHTFQGPSYAHFAVGDRVVFNINTVHGRAQLTHIKLHPDDAKFKADEPGADDGKSEGKKGVWAKLKGMFS